MIEQLTTIPDPDNWLDVVTILAVALIAAIPTYFAQKARKAADSAHETAQVVREQVVNGHSEPMRADLDRAIAAINRLSEDMRLMRKDLFAEEERRHQSVKEIREEVDWKFNELNRRLGA